MHEPELIDRLLKIIITLNNKDESDIRCRKGVCEIVNLVYDILYGGEECSKELVIDRKA